ncbi:hypothetical protein LTS18_004801, partial [Coniosporium uncinatum]
AGSVASSLQSAASSVRSDLSTSTIVPGVIATTTLSTFTRTTVTTTPSDRSSHSSSGMPTPTDGTSTRAAASSTAPVPTASQGAAGVVRINAAVGGLLAAAGALAVL